MFKVIKGKPLNESAKREFQKLEKLNKKFPNISTTENRYFVYEGDIMRAGQNSFKRANDYYKEGRTIVLLKLKK